MSFKIHDNFQIGTNTVFNSAGLLQNSAITASLTFSNNTAGGVGAGVGGGRRAGRARARPGRDGLGPAGR